MITNGITDVIFWQRVRLRNCWLGDKRMNKKDNVLQIPKEIAGIIQEFNKGVNEILGNRVKKVILYGSYARGDYNESSDIDIMILTDLMDEEIIKFRDKILDYTYDLEWDNNFNFMLSPLIKNIDKFNYWLEAMPFYRNIEKEGVILSES